MEKNLIDEIPMRFLEYVIKLTFGVAIYLLFNNTKNKIIVKFKTDVFLINLKIFNIY